MRTALLIILFVPVVASAQVMQCDSIQLIDNIIKFLVGLAVVIATLFFAFVAIKYITSGTKPDKVSEAHKIFFDILFALVIVLILWFTADVILRVIPIENIERSGITPWSEVICID